MSDNSFNFSQEPFSQDLDLKFLFKSEQAETVYQKLGKSMQTGQGLLLLTGQAGSGKTLALKELAGRLQPVIKMVVLQGANDSYQEIIQNLYKKLGIIVDGGNFSAKLDELKFYLANRKEQNARIAIVIDDAHRLDNQVLKRLLVLETPPVKDHASLQMILVGLPMLEAKISQLNETADKRYTVSLVNIDNLSSDEVSQYINKRLKVAGCKRSDVFSDVALMWIADYSEGKPYLINKICSAVLALADESSQSSVSSEMVEQVWHQYLSQTPDLLDDGATEAVVEKLGAHSQQTFHRKKSGMGVVGIAVLSLFVVAVGWLVFSSLTEPKLRGDGGQLNNVNEWVQEALSQQKGMKQAQAEVVPIQESTRQEGKGLSDIHQYLAQLAQSQQTDKLSEVFEQAQQKQSQGQLEDAYLLYFYAARQGDADAAFKLAQMADPNTYNPKQSIHDKPSIVTAEKWYIKADLFGHFKAKQALQELAEQQRALNMR